MIHEVTVSLDEYLDRYRHKMFDWRTCNCWHFGVGWKWEVEGGDDPLDGFMMPSSLLDCARLLRANGSMRSQLSEVLHQDARPISYARYGDLILLPIGELHASIGICTGRLAAFVMEPGGLTFGSTLNGICTWLVGGAE